MSLNLVWFRNDLRIRDNPALWHAAEAGPVAAIYFVTPGQWRAHSMAACRVEFILRTLRVLSDDLEKLGIPLVIRQVNTFADVPQQMAAFCREQGVRRVLWNEEYPVDEVARDTAVEKCLAAEGVSVSRYHDRVICAPGTVAREDGAPYKVFTPFKKTWLRLLDSSVPDLLPSPRRQRSLPLKRTRVPTAVEGFTSSIDASLWPGGEGEAHDRLEQFIDTGLACYDTDRDLPAVDGTSTLSPYLAVGAISPQQCLVAALMDRASGMGGASGMYGTGEGGATWINELVWRDFYQHILWHFPQVCKYRPFKPETDAVPWRHDEKEFSAWCEGRTGVPLVDAGMRQLQRTGWMHNRVRMVTAMYLSKNLLIDWRWGERFFMAHLVDGDLAANNGGWQWSASTGTDAVPYFRIFNPFTQAQRFDPEALYIRHHVPELQGLEPKTIHDPARLARQKPAAYPAPLVDTGFSRDRALAAFRQA